MQYSQTAQDMIGHLTRARPGLTRDLALDFINQRMWTVLDRRPYWSGTLQRGVISIPTAYTTGTMTATQNSTTVVGVGTNWPVNDLVNTAFSEQVRAPGSFWVTPSSMTNITDDSVFVVDYGTAQQEICPIQDIIGPRILLNFTQPHSSGTSLWQSSLAGRQLRMNTFVPIYTINAIFDPQTAIIDNPWGGPNVTGAAYQILLIYTTISPNIKDLMCATDPVQQIELRVNVSQRELNLYDPNRQSVDNPQSLANLGPNLCGNQLYEIYPPQTTARSIWVLYNEQWPAMRLPGDRPPPFLNPTVMEVGALADAYRVYIPRGTDLKDPGFKPELSMQHEARFETLVIDAMSADEGKAQQAFKYNWSQIFNFGGNGSIWNQQHDVDVVCGLY